MPQINRRRFLTISASMAGLATFGATPAKAANPYQWRGTAMGSAARIILDHPDAAAIADRMAAEVSRLEDVFSLYRAGSALSQLNAAGRLDAPPFELLECLSLAGRVHMASEGAFDPTVQPLWAAYATAYANGRTPDAATIDHARAAIGWDRLRYDAGQITLAPGQALTLNGIAQGYVADRIAQRLSSEGLSDVLIDTGEIAAAGHQPDGTGWTVDIQGDRRITLKDRALATSAPLGTVLDQQATVGHILDPRRGTPTVAPWRQVSVSCPGAALADALSTAACLLPDRTRIDAMLAQFDGARAESLLSA